MHGETDSVRDGEGTGDADGATRRTALRTASVGLAAVTGVGTAGAAAQCVPRDELKALRETYANQDAVFEAVAGEQEMLAAIQDAGLYESEPLATYVSAAAMDCESHPRIEVIRGTPDGGVLTASVEPQQGKAYALHNTGDTVESIYTTSTYPCFFECRSYSPCCDCYKVVCYDNPDFYGPPCPYSVGGDDDVSAKRENCTPYCWRCECPDDTWDCIDVITVDPAPIGMPENWWEEAAL